MESTFCLGLSEEFQSHRVFCFSCFLAVFWLCRSQTCMNRTFVRGYFYISSGLIVSCNFLFGNSLIRAFLSFHLWALDQWGIAGWKYYSRVLRLPHTHGRWTQFVELSLSKNNLGATTL